MLIVLAGSDTGDNMYQFLFSEVKLYASHEHFTFSLSLDGIM